MDEKLSGICQLCKRNGDVDCRLTGLGIKALVVECPKHLLESGKRFQDAPCEEEHE